MERESSPETARNTLTPKPAGRAPDESRGNASPHAADVTTGGPASDVPALSSPRIFISYQRNVEPDVSLAQFLYGSLIAQHYHVFRDVEGIRTGTDYLKLIASEIGNSDFFIVLLSTSSVEQDWVAVETETAKERADDTGHPKILPVRVAYSDKLPMGFRVAIGRLQHFSWRGAADNERLLAELGDIIERHQPRHLASETHLVRGEHYIVSERMWRRGGVRESVADTTIVPVLAGKEISLSVTRGTGPGLFRVKVVDGGALEVAIWSAASYRAVTSQPGRFVPMMEGDTHAWCFERYQPDQPVLLRRPASRDPIVVTFDPDVVRAAWMITHQRIGREERFLVAMKQG